MPIGGFNPSDAARIAQAVEFCEKLARGPLPQRSAEHAIPAQQIRRFELKTALEPGGTAEAYLRVWSGSAYGTTDKVFDVQDGVLGNCRGRAQTETTAGSYGLAVQFYDGRWEIVAIDSATRCLGIITNTSPLTVDHVEGIDGASPTADVSETLEIVDRFGWSPVVGKKVLFEINRTTGDWEAYQMEC